MTEREPTVGVVMSTYNGEAWLAEQLDSILKQTVAPDEMIVRDDGSSDATLQLLRRFAEQAPFPVHVLEDKTNVGYARSFWIAFGRSTMDYAAFCDQDDEWTPDKIAVIKAEIKRSRPNAILHNWILRDDATGSRHEERGFARRSVRGPMAFHFMFVHRGCALVVRRKLFEAWLHQELPIEFGFSRVISHDSFATLLCNAAGRVVCLPNRLLIYRRHAKNTTPYHVSKDAREELTAKMSQIGIKHDYEVAADMYRYYGGVFSAKSAEDGCGEACRFMGDFCSRRAARYLARKRLYAATSRLEKAARLTHTLLKGCYRSPRTGGFGAAGLARDLINVVRDPAGLRA